MNKDSIITLVKANREEIAKIGERIQFNDDIYTIRLNNEICGIIEYHIPYEYSLKVEYIEVFDVYSNRGIATQAINKLKSEHAGHEIYGDALPTDCAIEFWKKLGAEFEMDMEIDEYRELKECIPFSIN